MLALLLSTLLLATAEVPPSTSLSSSHAAYDGNALVLTGHVLLDHGLGQMQAERASLQKQEIGTDFPFTMIELHKDVVLNLKNSSKLSCDRADLDFNELKGILFSAENSPVVFSDLIKKKIAVHLTSQSAELTFSKSGYDGKKHDYEVETILAKEDVVLEYGRDFVLHADRALYRRQLPKDNKAAPREFQGIISAYPKDNTSKCRVTHENDQVEAAAIDVDLLHGKISMHRPEGSLASALFPRVKEGTLQFKSEHLLWDQNKNTLTLQGKAHVEEIAVGDLSAEEELHLTYGQKEGKSFIKSIDTKGKALLHYGTHKLTCFGPIHLDRENLHVTLESPITDDVTPKDKQICYQEGEVRIYADKAAMEYSLFDGLLHPVSLALKENVRLFSKNETMHRRWALADRLTYSPATRTFILTAKPGKKVLFRDEEDGIAVSAQEVHVTYDAETKKEKIKGIGNVQLSFSAEEVNLLKKMFPSYE